MGRYYDGDIEGKFWFGLQGSDAPERFGAQEQEPNVTEYYVDRDDLPLVIKEIEKIENDPEVKKIITLFKDDKTFNFSKENIEKHALTRQAMEDYADLLLGKKILDYLEFDPNRFGCTIYADH